MAITTPSPAAIDTWREVIALLVEAADVGFRDSETDAALHSTAALASGLASAAIALLPKELDHLLNEVVLEERTALMSCVELIATAEQVTRRHPIEELPSGASRVIVGICDVMRETAP